MGGTGAILRAQDPSYARSGWISIFDFLKKFLQYSESDIMTKEGNEKKKD